MAKNTFVFYAFGFSGKIGQKFSTQTNTFHNLSCFLGNFPSNLFLLEKSGSTRPRGRIRSLPDWSPQKQVNAKFLHLAELCGQSRVILSTRHGYSWLSLTLLFPGLCCDTLLVIPAQLPWSDCGHPLGAVQGLQELLGALRLGVEPQEFPGSIPECCFSQSCAPGQGWLSP